jgi:hypothetical protein
LSTKHAFISYVSEDAGRVDQLQGALEASGIRVWRDKDDLFPGSDWATEISKAITSGSLAFIACFSEASDKREQSYQYEELIVAIEQFRQLPPNRQWLFPVRLDDVSVPEYSLGAGRTLDSIHRTDLFGPRRDGNLIKLLAAVSKLVGVTHAPYVKPAPTSQDESPTRRVKQMLREPSQEIELDDLVMGVAASVRDALREERFLTVAPRPQSNQEWLDFLGTRLTAYQEVVKPLAEILVVGGAWGEQKDGALWSRAIALVINARQETGNSRLIELQDYIPLHLTYSFALAATARENYLALNELLMTPWRIANERQPLIERIHSGLPFRSFDTWVPTVLTHRAEGKVIPSEELGSYSTGREPNRITPVSDYLFAAMKPLFTSLLEDEQDFEEAFDQMEILLALRAVTAKMHAHAAGRYAHGSWYGRYLWKSQFMVRGPVDETVRRFSEQRSAWKPLQQGVFKSEDEVDGVLSNFRDEVQAASRRHF